MSDAPPQRLQLRRTKGFNLQRVSLALNGKHAVNCARPGRFGNPLVVGQRVGELAVPRNRAEAASMFRAALEYVRAGGLLCPARLHDRFETILAHWHELRGVNPACWCPLPAPGEPDVCHAAVFLEIANETRA